MVPDFLKHRLRMVTLLVFTTLAALGGEPEYSNPALTKNFSLNASCGYGITNSLLKDKVKSARQSGVAIDFSLEYKLSRKVSFSFGPYFWIEQNDFSETNSSAGNNASDRRMMVTLQSHFKPFNKMPLTLSAGIGMGTAMYAEGNSKVTIDTRKQPEAEYHGGTAVTAGVSYPFRIRNHVMIAPGASYKTLFFNGGNNHSYDKMNTDSNVQLVDFSLKGLFEF